MSNWFADQIGNLAGSATYLFGGGAAEEERGKALDAQLAAMNAEQHDQGLYTDAQYLAVLDHQTSGATGNVQDQLQESGREGANQGLQDFKAGTFSAFTGLLGLVPAWLWVVGALAAFVYLGGLKTLKRGS